MSRRRFLALTAGAGAAAAVGIPLVDGASGSASTGAVLAGRRPLPERFRVPFAIPTELVPTAATADEVTYRLVQQESPVRILADVDTPIWGYNGQFPGPTIRVRRGQRMILGLRNELPVPTVLHLHGGRTPAESDGYPTDLLTPRGWRAPPPSMAMMPDPHARIMEWERSYRFPMDQRAATLWYHDHRMGFTGASVWRGLAGFVIVTDDEEQALGLPAGERDLPILIADRSFAADGSFAYPSLDPSMYDVPGVTTEYTAGVLGDVVLVNGRPWPVARVDGARYRLRLLNASNARRYRLRLDPAGDLVQIGSDGGLLEQPIVHEAIELAPAERFDVVVDFARYPRGRRVFLRNEFGSGAMDAVMCFDVGDRVPDPSRIPDRLSRFDPLPAAVRTRTFVFRNEGADGWLINGRPFDPMVSLADVRVGDTEIWRFVTDTHHPIHLHLAQFRVLSRGLSGPGPYDRGWKDVIDLRPAEEAAVIARFDGEPGRYVFHCHKLEHEDMAMMGTFTLS